VIATTSLETLIASRKESRAPMSLEELPLLTPAAQYVRMSTEHQKYSTENQRDVIVEYAAKRHYNIIKTYADDGRSGLKIEGRDALKQMLAEVQSGIAEYKVILVYDVSRWGRFQDADESAYYEYMCKRAGIQVIYCAEQFENDGSLPATIMKSVRRVMAGEYSRDLSVKIFKGQCRLVQLGYRQGGPAGFGLRRMLINQAGRHKGLLTRGEHKSLQTDRVILVPGPSEEIEIVRNIYRMFREGKREGEIAQFLQARGIISEAGRPWTRSMVHQILTNEKYIGNNVYNRISYKLKKKRIRNTQDMWIRQDGAFDPIVDVEAFYIARGIIQERHRIFSDDDLIDWLKRLLTVNGGLTAHLIDATDGAPSSSIYRSRFGSLIEAYKRAGYNTNRDYDFLQVNRHLRSLYPNVISDTVQQLRGIGATVAEDDTTEQLLINGEYSAALVLTRCRQTPRGSLRWNITLSQRTVPDITIIARMDASNEHPVDFYLLPVIDLPEHRLRLNQENGVFLDTYRFDSLSYFIQMAARVRIEVAA
jgi:DNA invertase Pin-like site-specific DNA recombinase